MSYFTSHCIPQWQICPRQRPGPTWHCHVYRTQQNRVLLHCKHCQLHDVYNKSVYSTFIHDCLLITQAKQYFALSPTHTICRRTTLSNSFMSGSTKKHVPSHTLGMKYYASVYDYGDSQNTDIGSRRTPAPILNFNFQFVSWLT